MEYSLLSMDVKITGVKEVMVVEVGYSFTNEKAQSLFMIFVSVKKSQQAEVNVSPWVILIETGQIVIVNVILRVWTRQKRPKQLVIEYTARESKCASTLD